MEVSFLTRPSTICTVQKMSNPFIAIKILKSVEAYSKSYFVSANRKIGRKYCHVMKLEPLTFNFRTLCSEFLSCAGPYGGG
jgi:hypothetical protein